MIGRANGLPLTLRQEEISPTPRRRSSCIGKHLLYCYFNRPQPFHNVALNDKIQISRFEQPIIISTWAKPLKYFLFCVFLFSVTSVRFAFMLLLHFSK